MARQYKNARKSQKLIVKNAAAKLDVSPSTLGAWESERKAPSIESLEAMADLYQVSTDYLLGRKEITPTPSLPLPGEVLKIYHGKSVWSSDYGWVLVNSIKSVLVCVDGSVIPFENAGSVYAAQPPFYEASLPDSKPLSKIFKTTKKYGLSQSLTMQNLENNFEEPTGFTGIGQRIVSGIVFRSIPMELNGWLSFMNKSN